MTKQHVEEGENQNEDKHEAHQLAGVFGAKDMIFKNKNTKWE